MKRTDLHEYQNYCVDFLKTHAEAMLILEMGLGKSAISLTAIADLMFDSFDVGKTLVIAPCKPVKCIKNCYCITSRWRRSPRTTLSSCPAGGGDRL